MSREVVADIPQSQQVSHEASPDAVADELVDVLDIVLRWRAGSAGS